MLKKSFLTISDSSRICFVSTQNIYQVATKDIAILLGAHYSAGQIRGTFSNRLKNASLSKNCYTPVYFFLLNSENSSNFLQELVAQNSSVKLASIFSFPTSTTIPFIPFQQVLLMLQQHESVYKVFLYMYLISAIQIQKI
mgnify:CR=1 FL=1